MSCGFGCFGGQSCHGCCHSVQNGLTRGGSVCRVEMPGWSWEARSLVSYGAGSILRLVFFFFLTARTGGGKVGEMDEDGNSQGHVGAYITVATKTAKGHLVRWLLQARRRSTTASRGLRDWSRRVRRGRHSVIVVRIRNRDRSRVADLRSAVSHGGRVVAKLDSRLGTTNGATIGDVAARAVGSHGYGAFSKVVGAGAVEGAAGDGRNCGRDGLFAVHWRGRRGSLGILRRRGRGANHQGGVRAGRNYRRLRGLLWRTCCGGI